VGRRNIIVLLLSFLIVIFVGVSAVYAVDSATYNEVLGIRVAPTPTGTPTPTPGTIVREITEKNPETLGPLEKLIDAQMLKSVFPFNPVKYAIRGAVNAGVPANTIVLLLLLPVIALVIAFSRNIIGIRGFGIFLPATLSVVFTAIGPVMGLILFILIVLVSTGVRMALRGLKIKLQYLPRMSLILLFVVMGVLGLLFSAPLIQRADLARVSIFPVLFLVLLAEDFTRVQLGKSAKTALSLTSETLILALISYVFLTLKPLQEWALLNPELLLIGVLILNFVLGRYSGLRLMEIVRFKRLIKS
jgi:hypothetical protein